MASSRNNGGERLSREEVLQKRAIEEARKLGQLPPEVDVDGNIINPHIPSFMAKAPWYLNQAEGLGLRHQKKPGEQSSSSSSLDEWYKRGKDAVVQQRGDGAGKKRPRKGGCKNCGATTHDAKNCMERPRKVGAWKTGEDVAPDDVVQKQLTLSYEASRDRWAGYDPSDHVRTVKLFNKAEEEKRKQVLREKDEKFRNQGSQSKTKEEEDDSDSSDSDEDNKDQGEEDVLGMKQTGNEEVSFQVGNKVTANVLNLRVRHDVAKYLRNLDPDSAYYDPKTRSMRANPTPNVDPNELEFAGDNFTRVTGDAVEMAKTQVFAWEASEKGQDLHMQANPTQVMLARKQFEERAKKLKEMKKKKLQDEYGGEEHVTEKPNDAVLVGSSSQYVEYAPDGRVLKGKAENTKHVAKYQEDVLEGNHSQIWGSYFDKEEMKWGYGCCFQTNRKAYCTGESGKAAKMASRNVDTSKAKFPDRGAPLKPQGNKPVSKTFSNDSHLYGSSEAKVELDKDKLKRALARYGDQTQQESDEDKTKKRGKKKKSKSKGKKKKSGSKKKKSKKKGRSRKYDSDSDSASSSSSSSSSLSSSSSSRKKKRRKVDSKTNSRTRDDDKKEASLETMTAEEMEAYRMKRIRAEDPMADLLKSNDVLPLNNNSK